MRKRGSCRDEWLAPQRSMRPEMGRVRREGDRLCAVLQGGRAEGAVRMFRTENRLSVQFLLPLPSWCFDQFNSQTQPYVN